MSAVMETPTWLTTGLQDQQQVFAKLKWLHDLKQEQAQAFLQRGFPSRREELWKYTDVSFLQKATLRFAAPTKITSMPAASAVDVAANYSQLVFVNGHYAPELSDISALPKGVILCPLARAIEQHEAITKPYLQHVFDAKRYPFASLGTALMRDGIFLHIPNNTVVSNPIRFLFINSGDSHFISCPRILVVAGESSQVVILEEHVGLEAENYFTNVLTDIHAGNNAQIAYHKIQNESASATHIAQIFVTQQQDSCVKTHSLSAGGRLSREELSVNLMARGAECETNGFYWLNHDDQHVDNHVQIDHVAEHGTSDMFYKGILDKKSRAVFNGKIYVHPGAQKTVAHQANHNLLLSVDAEINTKPELEIYADDVKCAHGDTVGQLNAESLFYLRSRGIEKSAALRLLTHGFAADIMSRIRTPVIQQRMNGLLNEKMGGEIDYVE